MAVDTKALRAAAAGATTGPWANPWDADEDADKDAFRAPDGSAVIGSVATDFVEEGHALQVTRADAAFVVAASPDAVLALLDEVERLRRVEEAVRDLECWGDDVTHTLDWDVLRAALDAK